MTENQRGKEIAPDELSLLSLFEKLFAFVRNYGLLIVICSACGIILGYATFKTTKKQYASTLLLHSFSSTNTEHINIIEDWNKLLKNGEYTTLAGRFNCNESTIRKLTSITGTEIQKLYVQNNPNGFTVNVLVTDNSILDTVQRGIVYALENSDYMKVRIESRREDLTQLINKTKTEIDKLDSVKKNIEANISSNTQRGSSYIIDISGINKQVIELTEKLLDYKQQFRYTSAVQVLHDFEKFKNPASPKFLKCIILGLIGGFGIGYILSLYLYIRKKIRSRIK